MIKELFSFIMTIWHSAILKHTSKFSAHQLHCLWAPVLAHLIPVGYVWNAFVVRFNKLIHVSDFVTIRFIFIVPIVHLLVLEEYQNKWPFRIIISSTMTIRLPIRSTVIIFIRGDFLDGVFAVSFRQFPC